MGTIAIIALIVIIIGSSICTINQGTIGVTTIFGKYNRMLSAGLNFKIPLIEQIFKRVSIQNRSAELDFQAITQDQANVYFKAMLLYAVFDQQEKTVHNVAFKFMNDRDFMTALVRTIEGSIRGFVATQKQAEILSLRKEIVNDVKEQLDHTLEEWGFHLIDLQLNDITFDDAITKSMAQVVASNNLKAAAENEGQALLITKTKAAEADGNAIRIQAEAERTAAQLRGQGVALFRQEVALGMTEAAKQMQNADLDASLILFAMWTESLKHFAELGHGNTIFLDGNVDAMQRTMKELMAINQMHTKTK
ncbi:MAG: SPFH domain-containing protein [Saprospiraceae bacterium]|jgi:regulator of protease activity HflC (stomatin/prohibitin superfamily)|nr:SPFH domain-containing protein [Saprospiraceae bacterium]